MIPVWKLTLTEIWGTGQYHLIILTLLALLFAIDACKPKGDIVAGKTKEQNEAPVVKGHVTAKQKPHRTCMMT